VPGTPILYYRANPASKTIVGPTDHQNRIYNVRDNAPLVNLGQLADWATPLASRRVHPLGQPAVTGHEDLVGDVYFYEYIRDPKIPVMGPAGKNPPWPHRPDSYILISAGHDGLYGTPDDIRNFGKR
jgi:hypothetical protein